MRVTQKMAKSHYNLLDRGELISLLTWTLVDTVLCVAFVIGFVVFFREKVNRVNRYTKLLSQNVYVVYFLHVPIVVFLQNLFSSVSIPTVLKFICVTFLGVFISFTISHFVWRRIPYLKNIM